MDVQVEVAGLDEAIKKLEAVEQKVSISKIRSALRFAAKPAIERAKQLVPVDESDTADDYRLKDTIGLQAERKKYRRGNATVMRFGAHRQTLPANDPSGYAIAGGLNKSARAPNYAQLVEEETPFLLPAIEQTQSEMVRRFGEQIIKAVKKL